MRKEIRVFAPATVANVACGFDIFGFAVEKPGDEVVARFRNESGVAITKIEGDNGRLTKDPEKNTAGVSVLRFLEHIGSRQGFDLELYKKMPLGSGLGSSAASSVASVVAVNELLGRPLPREELLPFTMEGERVACGAAHADNAAPALLGGFVLIRSYKPLDVVRLSTPKDLWCIILHPDVEVRTEDARRILPREITLQNAIAYWGNTAGLVAGLFTADYALIGRSLQDTIIEPVRSILIPGFDAVKRAALKAGAFGCSISGSGPSIFALSTSSTAARTIGQAMQRALIPFNLDSAVYVSKINEQGPRVY